MAIGILTSGAFPVEVADQLATMRQRLNIETISTTVNVVAPDPNTFAKVTGEPKSQFQLTCSFVGALAATGFPVNTFAVQHPVSFVLGLTFVVQLLCVASLWFLLLSSPCEHSRLSSVTTTQAVKRKMRATRKMASTLGSTSFFELPYYPSTLYDVLELEDGQEVWCTVYVWEVLTFRALTQVCHWCCRRLQSRSKTHSMPLVSVIILTRYMPIVWRFRLFFFLRCLLRPLYCRYFN